jgi:hypothetical protein
MVATRRPGQKPMLRSTKAETCAREVSGDGGTGLGSGSTKLISQASRTPRSVAHPSSVSALRADPPSPTRGLLRNWLVVIL